MSGGESELAVLLLIAEIIVLALENILELHGMGPHSSTKTDLQHVLTM